MTILAAKAFARNKTLKATGLLLTILIILLLLSETKGDFANGFLFFLEALANIHTIILAIILFGLTYFLAGLAGQEIMLKKQSILFVSLKYAILISLAIYTYVIFIGFSREENSTFNTFVKVLTAYLPLFFKMIISLMIVWLWAANKMKSNACVNY
jgi:hypothetical protein